MVQNFARIVAGPVQWMHLASLRALAITSLNTAHQWALVAMLYRLAMQNEKEVQA
jgi:lysozyme family protein